MRFQQHYRLYACFLLFSIVTGAMMSRLPDIQRHLQVTEGQLGLTLIGGAIGSLISLTFSSPLIARLGARNTLLITVLGSVTFYSAIPWISWAPLAFALLFVAGLLSGALEIALNVEIDRTEAQLGYSIMSRAHGFWSLGFFFTALAAAGIRQLGIPAEMHLLGVLVVVVVVGALLISGIENAPARPTAADASGAPLIAFPTWSLLPLCIIGLAAFLIEGASVDWSTIYMRDVFHAEPLIGGMALTAFTLVMAIARLSAGTFVDRYSPRAVVSSLLVLAAVGLVATWLAPNTTVAILGFALLGVGCSAVYPLAISAAAQRTDRPASVNVAAVSQMSFIIFFLGPPLLGGVAQFMGIRNSYLVCLPVVILALFMVPALSSRPRPLPPGETPPEPLSSHG